VSSGQPQTNARDDTVPFSIVAAARAQLVS
jgi:hypothetical protein